MTERSIPVPLRATTDGASQKRRQDPPRVESEALAQMVATLALDKKADDPRILEVTALTSYTDYCVVVSAPSERQAVAISTHIRNELARASVRPIGVEGQAGGGWCLLDYGDVVVHVFADDARAYYDLDGFWADAPTITVEEARGQSTLEALQEEARSRGDDGEVNDDEPVEALDA